MVDVQTTNTVILIRRDVQTIHCQAASVQTKSSQSVKLKLKLIRRSKCTPASQGTVYRDCWHPWLPGQDGSLGRLHSTALRPQDPRVFVWGVEERARPLCWQIRQSHLQGVTIQPMSDASRTQCIQLHNWDMAIMNQTIMGTRSRVTKQTLTTWFSDISIVRIIVNFDFY